MLCRYVEEQYTVDRVIDVILIILMNNEYTNTGSALIVLV